MATVEATLTLTTDGVAGDQRNPCGWETVVGPCRGLFPRNALQEIVFYDGRPMLVCPNHIKVWEKERGLYMKHIRVQ